MAGLLDDPEGATRIAVSRNRSSAFVSLLLGQLISLLITGTAVFASALTQDGLNIPAVQSGINYVLLCMHFMGTWIWDFSKPTASSNLQESTRVPTWRYMIWAFCDFEANYLVVLAYQYTSVVSVMLLDCFAIPCAMVISRYLLGSRYGRGHIAACLFCMMGLSLTVLSDAISGKAAPTPKGPAWLGDLLVLASASLYGFSNVQQEMILKSIGNRRRAEALGNLGLWGCLLAFVQVSLLERHQLFAFEWSPRTLICLLGFQLCLFCMYVLTSSFLLKADATLFNLSLLTVDVYTVIFAWRVQHQHMSWLYAGAFGMTLSGVVAYTLQTPPAQQCSLEDVSAAERTAPLLAAEKALGAKPSMVDAVL